MLRSLLSLKSYRLEAKDGELGTLTNFYFDDERWTVRYMGVNISSWLPGADVLVPIVSVKGDPGIKSRTIPVELTREQVKNAPTIDDVKPVSRQMEKTLLTRYRYPAYWHGFGVTPSSFDTSSAEAEVERYIELKEKEIDSTHLRSLNEVRGYHVAARDNTFGHVEDFIVDDEAPWKVRYLVIDTKNYWPFSKQVIVAPDWTQGIRWGDREVALNLTEQQVKDSPTYSPDEPINREREVRLYDYYGRPKYWEDEAYPHPPMF